MDQEVIIHLSHRFSDIFHTPSEAYISTGGRLEIIGNHTDHNHGLCLVANCSLRMNAVIAKSEDVTIKSEGYDIFSFSPSHLELEKGEENTSLALVKGILFKLQELGYVIGGFKAYIESHVPAGSGVSSSAAFEILIGAIISKLYNQGHIDSLTLAKVGQFSEREYFHKPCGLLDQIGAAYPKCNFLDFKDINNPIVQTIAFDLPLSIYLISSLGDHSDLVDLYAGIPGGMKKVAHEFQEEYLRDVNEEEYFKKDSLVKDDAHLKANHFFLENHHVLQAVEALKERDEKKFLDAIRKSQDSSQHNLKNTFVEGEYVGSPQEIIDTLNSFITPYGAVRIHGGGFKGSVICFIDQKYEKEFEDKITSLYAKDRWTKVSISNTAIDYLPY